VNGFQFLSEAYAATDPNFDGRVTVPVLWDKEKRRIVNNSEDDICRMFNSAFGKLADEKVDLFPADIEREHSQLSSFIYDNINNGVYKAGFCHTPARIRKGMPLTLCRAGQARTAVDGQPISFRPADCGSGLAAVLHACAL